MDLNEKGIEPKDIAKMEAVGRDKETVWNRNQKAERQL